MAWRCAQTAVSNLSNVYHSIFAKPEKHQAKTHEVKAL